MNSFSSYICTECGRPVQSLYRSYMQRNSNDDYDDKKVNKEGVSPPKNRKQIILNPNPTIRLRTCPSSSFVLSPDLVDVCDKYIQYELNLLCIDLLLFRLSCPSHSAQ